MVAPAPGWLIWLYAVLLITGFALAGASAASLRPDTPVVHGGLSALIAFVTAALIGIVVAVLRDESVRLVALPISASLALTTGVAGALAADYVRRRKARDSQIDTPSDTQRLVR